jgi:hypothetical protein
MSKKSVVESLLGSIWVLATLLSASQAAVAGVPAGGTLKNRPQPALWSGSVTRDSPFEHGDDLADGGVAGPWAFVLNFRRNWNWVPGGTCFFAVVLRIGTR